MRTYRYALLILMITLVGGCGGGGNYKPPTPVTIDPTPTTKTVAPPTGMDVHVHGQDEVEIIWSNNEPNAQVVVERSLDNASWQALVMAPATATN